MIPDKIPDFLGSRIRLFGIPTLLDPNPTFYYLFDTRHLANHSTTSFDSNLKVFSTQFLDFTSIVWT